MTGGRWFPKPDDPVEKIGREQAEMTAAVYNSPKICYNRLTDGCGLERPEKGEVNCRWKSWKS